ncbi:putative Ig domain-containing protein [Sporosarcina sp. FSL K6-3457]|uniref:putative Ig domain-containing protein n=1 Tax=Sporosarcina sp. FSL K6-3457 TaxID=2978204 RepID=UPI0030F656BF
MTFRIYKGGSMVVEGVSPLAITGLLPDTTVANGEYQVARVESGKESAKVDIPAFTTLPIKVTGVTLSPKTSSAEVGTVGSRQLTAAIEPINATNAAVTYSIAPTTAGLSVSTTGLIEWDDTVADGVYTTTVTTDDGGNTDTHVLTLTTP